MPRTTSFRLILGLSFSFVLVDWSPANCSPQVDLWFAPESHYPPAKTSDFLELFRHPEQWHEALETVTVLELSTQFFVHAPQSVIDEVATLVRQYHIRLAVASEASCGRIEGTPELASIVVEKVKRAEGKIDLIAMDEPFFNVYQSKKSGNCHLSLLDAVSRVSNVIDVYTNAFPRLSIADVEPFPAVFGTIDWQHQYGIWLESFRLKTKRPIEMLHLDIDWREPSVTTGTSENENLSKLTSVIERAAETAARQYLQLGVIVNGKSTAKSDKVWFDQSVHHLENFLASSHPNEVVLQSWHLFPEKHLPETREPSFTSLILRVCKKVACRKADD